MVKGDEPWPCPQQSAWQWVNQSFMSSLLEPGQGEYLPAWAHPGTRPLSADVAFPRSDVPNIPRLGTEQTCPSLFPPYFREKQFVFSPGISGTALLNASSSEKKLLVFDQCGTQTRLIYSSATPITGTTKVTCHYGLYEDERAAKVDQIGLTKSVSHIESAENCCGDESELHEDTEELNALLYSDDEYNDYSDEETSTGHSPMPNIEHQFEEIEEVSSFSFPKKRHEATTEEVSDSNGPNKRQKFIDVGHRTILMDTASSIKLVESHNSDDYAESSCAIRKTRRGETGSVSDDERVIKRQNIRETLRVLESIVPGVKGKDQLLVLDSAIEYLKCMKLKAVTLGVDSLLA